MVRYTKLQASKKGTDFQPRPSPRTFPSVGAPRPAFRSKTPEPRASAHQVKSAGNTPRSPASPRVTPFSANQQVGRSTNEIPSSVSTVMRKDMLETSV